MSLFLSIDFEDFAHDLKRDLGLWETGPLRVDALWRAYRKIDDFLNAHGGEKGRHATFFCTGIIAEQAPDLIARIARDGHEIACHHHFHDEMDGQDIATVRDMLARAKDRLEGASGTRVRGFRAPKFRIERSAPEQYHAVEQLFSYDSSLPVGTLGELSMHRRRLGLTRLKSFPIYSERIAGRTLRLGGSYLKLFPTSLARHLIAQARAAGMTPISTCTPMSSSTAETSW